MVSDVKKVLRLLSIIMSSVGSSVSFLPLFILFPLEGLSFRKKCLSFVLYSYLAQKAHMDFSSDIFHYNKL